MRTVARKNVAMTALGAGLAFGMLVTSSCSSITKKKVPELSQMEGKKVALVEIDGNPSATSIVEVALVNQLGRSDSFILVPKSEMKKARASFETNPTDYDGIAKKAGADYYLRLRVMQFDADINEGYSTEKVNDSQLEAERGKGQGKTERLFKVKSIDGKVRILFEFKHLESGDVRTAIAEREDRQVEEGKTSAVHLPPKLRYLENLTNQAFRDFFDLYN